MACGPCQKSGRLNADANRVYDPDSARVLREAAVEQQRQCEDPESCDRKLLHWAENRCY